MDIEFKSFKTQSNNQGASTFQTFYECSPDTKINCVISGPMQKSMGGESEACQIKVNVEFISSFSTEVNTLLLEQFPDAKEQLEQACANMPSEAAAQHEQEQRIKFLTQGVIQQTLQRILSSVILGNNGTQILFDFTVIDCDQDLMQALVNCASCALMASKFQLKCIPTAICILRSSDSFKVDPSLSDIQEMRQRYSHKLFCVLDSQKEEFIYHSLTALSWRGEKSNEDALDLESMEKLMGLAQSCCTKMHEYVVEQ